MNEVLLKNMNSDPPPKSQAQQVSMTLVLGGRARQIPQAHRLAILAESVSSRFSDRICVKKSKLKRERERNT